MKPKSQSVFQEILSDAESDGLYKICECAESDGPKPGKIIAKIRMCIFTEEDLMKWVQKFEEKCFITWGKMRTYPNVGTRTVFKVNVHPMILV